MCIHIRIYVYVYVYMQALLEIQIDRYRWIYGWVSISRECRPSTKQQSKVQR